MGDCRRVRAFAALLIILTGCIGFGHQARANQTYVVKPGETLGSIAEQLYGDQLKWKILYLANRQAIGEEPGRLEIGTELKIPPLDDVDASSVGRNVDGQAPDVATSTLPEVRLLGRENFSPFVDPSSPIGGVISAVVNSALRLAGYKPKLDFSGFEGAPKDLMRANFPYARDDEIAADHLYSVPIVTVGVVPYSYRRSTIIAAKPAAAEQKAEPVWLTKDGLLDCFQGVLDGTLADPSAGSRIVEQLGQLEEFRGGEQVIDLGSLHVLAPKFSSYNSAMIYRLNAALNAMRLSGALDVILRRNESPDPVLVIEGQPTARPTAPQDAANSQPENVTRPCSPRFDHVM